MLRFISLLFLLFVSLPAAAQEYLDQPICFTIVNQADYKVYGDVATAADTYHGDAVATTDKIHYTATFRLEPDETYDICTTGPLYQGNKVRLTLRTLVPIFECLSAVYPGARINIRGQYNEEEYRTETWAECL